MTNEPKLLPCLCGCEKINHHKDLSGGSKCWIFCSGCSLSVEAWDWDKVLALWNHRPPSPEAKGGDKYEKGSGIIKGPFPDCECPSHHVHGRRGPEGCPACNPPVPPEAKERRLEELDEVKVADEIRKANNQAWRNIGVEEFGNYYAKRICRRFGVRRLSVEEIEKILLKWHTEYAPEIAQAIYDAMKGEQ